MAWGIVEQFGTPKGRDPARAVKIFEEQCQNGSVVGCSQLGVAVQIGSGLFPDPKRGISVTQRACEDGDTWACTMLSGWYKNGFGVEANARVSQQWAERACTKAEPRACSNLGVLLVGSEKRDRAEIAKGMSLLTDACAAGSAHACLNLAYCYTGKVHDDVKADPPQVRRMAERACDLGSMMGCTDLGKLLIGGEYGEKDPTRGQALLERICMAGFGPACAAFEQDPEVVLPRLERGCADGSMVHCWRLGHWRGFTEHEPTKDLVKAVESLSKACKGEEMAACATLGFLQVSENPSVRDVDVGRSLLERACRGGIGQACRAWMPSDTMVLEVPVAERAKILEIAGLGCRLGDVLLCHNFAGAHQVWNDGETGTVIGVLEHACNLEIANACTNLSYLYSTGARVPSNLPLVRQFARRACDLGDVQGCENVALAEMKRTPDEIDWTRVLQDAQRACTAASPSTCGALAFVAAFGPAQNIPDVKQQLEGACAKADGESCNGLSVMYFAGQYVSLDIDKGVEMAGRACQLREPAACSNLGMLYEEGLGVPKDVAKALEFSTRACEAGHAGGCARLGRLCWGKGRECKLGGNPVDPSILLNQVCNAGDVRGCVALGDGLASEKTTNAGAEDAFRRGCALSDGAWSCRKLGQWLLKNNRAQEAADALEKALLGGDAEAATTAWQLSAQGWIAPRKVAQKLEEACSDKHNWNACHVLGTLRVQKGSPVGEDVPTAVRLFQQACEQGAVLNACTRYGLAQFCGHGGIIRDQQAGTNRLRNTCRGSMAAPGVSSAFASFGDPQKGDKQACLALETMAAGVNVCAK